MSIFPSSWYSLFHSPLGFSQPQLRKQPLPPRIPGSFQQRIVSTCQKPDARCVHWIRTPLESGPLGGQRQECSVWSKSVLLCVIYACVRVCVCAHTHACAKSLSTCVYLYKSIWLFATLWTALQVQKALLECKEVTSDTNMSARLVHLSTGFQWAGSSISNSVRGHDKYVHACWVASVVSNSLRPYGP